MGTTSLARLMQKEKTLSLNDSTLMLFLCFYHRKGLYVDWTNNNLLTMCMLYDYYQQNALGVMCIWHALECPERVHSISGQYGSDSDT